MNLYPSIKNTAAITDEKIRKIQYWYLGANMVTWTDTFDLSFGWRMDEL